MALPYSLANTKLPTSMDLKSQFPSPPTPEAKEQQNPRPSFLLYVTGLN